jgi:excisionase family DNA binding protein
MAQQNADQVVADGFMTVGEAVKFLALSRSKVYALMDQGRLVYAKTDRARRIPRRAVIEFAMSTLRGGDAAEGVNDGSAA